MTVLAGLNFASVQRMKKTWKGLGSCVILCVCGSFLTLLSLFFEAVSTKTMAEFARLEELMSSANNYQVGALNRWIFCVCGS